MLLGCNIEGEGTGNSKLSEKKEMSDSLKREKEKQIELEIASLKEQGIFGKWECTYPGVESIISLTQKDDNYSITIDYKRENSKTRNEKLQKNGEKYFVLNSSTKEYYIINSEGNLELWDNVGLFTTAKNIMPDIVSKPLPEFEINKVIGQNISIIKGKYSKSSPETLNGTNNKYWIVYYEDINTTFKVTKKTDRIKKAKKGKIPNMD